MKRYIITAFVLMAMGGMPMQAQRILSLDEALTLARQNNRTLQNAALEISMAGEQKKEAYTQYFPQISAQVVAFQAFDKLIKGDGIIPDEVAALGTQFADLAGQPYSFGELSRAYSISLSVMQPVYAGGQITNGNKLAAIQQDVVKLQQNIKEKDVVQRVTENYWQIAQVKYNLQTLDAADKQIAEAEKTTSTYLKAGLTTRNDLLKVQLRQNELKSDRLKLNNAEHVLRLLLAQMTGLAGEDVDILPDEMLADDPSTVFLPSGDAVYNRDELQLLDKALEAQQLQVKMERGKNLPSVAVGVMGFNSGFGGLSSTVKDNLKTNITNGMVMATVSVPISSWWGGSHAIKRQRLKLQQAQNDLADAREQLVIDIESSWANLTEAYEQVGIAQKSVEQAAENLRMVNDQYKAGTIDLNDLLDAETLNRQALGNLASALAKYQIEKCNYQLKTR